MAHYKDAGTLQTEIESLLGREVDGVTVNHNNGQVRINDPDLTDRELERIDREITVEEQDDPAGHFRRDTGPAAGERGNGGAGGGGGSA